MAVAVSFCLFVCCLFFPPILFFLLSLYISLRVVGGGFFWVFLFWFGLVLGFVFGLLSIIAEVALD